MVSNPSHQTIFAMATAAGRAGIAVVRLSGQGAGAALVALGLSSLPPPRYAVRAHFRHPQTGDIIDHGLALYFPGPHSFTGEEVVELHLHGSRAVLKEMLSALSSLPGLRLAEPGEFSRRAFLSGKFGLTEAEGLIDLIDAETSAQKKQALHALSGHSGAAYAAMRERIIRALALLEAYLDFPDEDIPEATLARVEQEVTALRNAIGLQLRAAARGEKIREGIRVVILGAPNAGKSSLLNLLAGRDVAIVSTQAGTTRDVLEVELDLGGYKVILVDTAGLREAEDIVEKEGVARARKHAAAADLKLALFDAAGLHLDLETLTLIDERTLCVASRYDLCADTIAFGASWNKAFCGGRDFLPLSVSHLIGTEEILERLQKVVETLLVGETPLITHQRHREFLEAAQHHLAASSTSDFLELRCEDLRRAAVEIGKITGKIDLDEVLDVVFREFCIGK